MIGKATGSKAFKANNIYLFIAAILFLGFACTVEWSPGRQGDGFEYMAMSEAFVSHATPDVRISDARELAQQIPEDRSVSRLSKQLIDSLSHGKGTSAFYVAQNGRAYSYHFWLYSLINAPVLVVTQWFGLTPDNAFLITNTLFIAVLIGFIAFGTNWLWARKALLTFMTLCCGATFYIGWTSTEIMTFALLLAGLIFFEKRSYALAFVIFAAAAQQNPPVGILAVVSACGALWQAVNLWLKQKELKRLVINVLQLVPGAALLIASPLFYWLNFGTPSLIMKAGFTDHSLISFGRLLSLFFDPNQGMIIAMPAVFVLLGVLVVSKLKQPKTVMPALLLALSTIVLAVPALGATNWNAGSTVVMRYALWLSAPLLYAVAWMLSSVRRQVLLATCSGVLVVSQIALLSFYGIQGDYGTRGKQKWGYVYPTPMATRIMNEHPSWYQPIPEIFVERGLHKEFVLDNGRSYLRVSEGRVKALLFHGSTYDVLGSLCGIERGQRVFHTVESGWAYSYPGQYCPTVWNDGFYSLPEPFAPLRPSSTCRLTRSSTCASQVLGFGFSKPESWGAWSNERLAVVHFIAPSSYRGRPVDMWRISIRFIAYTHRPQVPSQRIVVTLNGEQVMQTTIASKKVLERRFVVATAGHASPGTPVLLAFRMPWAESPKKLGIASDNRQLGVGLLSIRIAPVGNH